MIKNLCRAMMCYTIVALFSFTTISAQNFKYPLALPMSLSGNYGELRSNHFHGGVDFRVGGVVGAPIHATEDGYISQISVSPSGYGNALYITHANGFVSVYGHMLCFTDKIQEYVRQKQYETEEFRQTLPLTPDLFPVKKGDLIGKAGNTGSSGGPHLHFEIRDSSNVPLNVFARKIFTIPDKTPPVINSVAFYGCSKDTGVVNSYYIGVPSEGVIRLPELSYVAIDAIDKQEGTAAKLAVNEYKVYLDTTLIYALSIGEVPFEWGRYINSLMDYDRRMAGKYMIKSYVEPGNLLKERITCKNQGFIILKDSLKHKVRVEVLDYLKNKTVRNYTVIRDDKMSRVMPEDTVKANFMAWYLPGLYSTNGLNVHIPQASLYSSIYFQVDTAQTRITPYAPVWKIHKPTVPLHFPMEIRIQSTLPDSLRSKAFIAQVSPSGRLSYAGGECDSTGTFKTKTSAFGDYTVATDITPPKITPSIANNAIVKGNKISFVIGDNLSGVNTYRVEIDGHWALAELDGKTSRLTVPLQYAKIKKGGKHNLVITVTDRVGNIAIVKRNFTW